MQFQELNLIPALCANLAKEGYEQPTPIQEKAIPPVLEGRDLVACAQTGTGKTAAFALPILQNLSKKKTVNTPCGAHVLILTPTRELAEQIGQSFTTYGRGLGLRFAVIYGGVGYVPQKDALRRGVDVLVATPGRLLDLLEQRSIMLSRTQVFILDEADRMLDMGFIRDVRKIAGMLPAQRQTLLFSATMPAEIRSLADQLLQNPAQVQVAPQSATADNIDQTVYFVDKNSKPALLRHILVNDDAAHRVLVFTRTKHGADRVAHRLCQQGINAESIHGNKTQNARQRSLNSFKAGGARVLVATDIASRGIDIDSISHVVNYELPDVPETYVHRIGRTARAGASGVSVSFCDNTERYNLRDIEKLIRQKIKVVETPALAPEPASARSAYGGDYRRQDGGAGYSRPLDREQPDNRARRNERPFFERFIGGSHRRDDRQGGNAPSRDGRSPGSGRSFGGGRSFEGGRSQGNAARKPPRRRFGSQDRSR
jgi:ATP-dependent RNA helicase RhlE